MIDPKAEKCQMKCRGNGSKKAWRCRGTIHESEPWVDDEVSAKASAGNRSRRFARKELARIQGRKHGDKIEESQGSRRRHLGRYVLRMYIYILKEISRQARMNLMTPQPRLQVHTPYLGMYVLSTQVTQDMRSRT